jgi:hypothetical protein
MHLGVQYIGSVNRKATGEGEVELFQQFNKPSGNHRYSHFSITVNGSISKKGLKKIRRFVRRFILAVIFILLTPGHQGGPASPTPQPEIMPPVNKVEPPPKKKKVPVESEKCPEVKKEAPGSNPLNGQGEGGKGAGAGCGELPPPSEVKKSEPITDTGKIGPCI